MPDNSIQPHARPAHGQGTVFLAAPPFRSLLRSNGSPRSLSNNAWIEYWPENAAPPPQRVAAWSGAPFLAHVQLSVDNAQLRVSIQTYKSYPYYIISAIKAPINRR